LLDRLAYAASGTACACANRATIVRSAWSATRSGPHGAHEEAARVKSEGVATLLANPASEPPSPGLDALINELLERAHEAARRGVISAPPRRSAEELVASDRAS